MSGERLECVPWGGLQVGLREVLHLETLEMEEVAWVGKVGQHGEHRVHRIEMGVSILHWCSWLSRTGERACRRLADDGVPR